jgi:hypothetical protein
MRVIGAKGFIAQPGFQVSGEWNKHTACCKSLSGGHHFWAYVVTFSPDPSGE